MQATGTVSCGSRLAIVIGHHPTRPATVCGQLRRLVDGQVPGRLLAPECCAVESAGGRQSRLLLSLPVVAAEQLQLDILVAAGRFGLEERAAGRAPVWEWAASYRLDCTGATQWPAGGFGYSLVGAAALTSPLARQLQARP